MPKVVWGAIFFSLLMSIKLALAFDEVYLSEVENKLIGVRLNDLINVHPNAFIGAANLNEVVNKNSDKILASENIELVHSIFLAKKPEARGGAIALELSYFVKTKSGQFKFLTFEVTYSNFNSIDFNQFQFSILKTVNLEDTSLSAAVGLVDRKLIIDDKEKNIKMVMPIGVGSFDEGVMNEGKVSLLTPRFNNGFLDKRVVDSKREKPKYFKGKPFIRLLKGSDPISDRTPIGFHIEINDSFVRGFDSHGCMRLREMDLMSLHDLVMGGSNIQIPIIVKYRLQDLSDSPILKRNKVFKTILNKGSKSSPFFILDRDNLVQTTLASERELPVNQLVDDLLDNYEDQFSYDTQSQLSEQEKRREKECKLKAENGTIKNNEKKIRECIDEGKRKDTLADKIYRKFMGIDSFLFSI